MNAIINKESLEDLLYYLKNTDEIQVAINTSYLAEVVKLALKELDKE